MLEVISQNNIQARKSESTPNDKSTDSYFSILKVISEDLAEILIKEKLGAAML